MLKKETFTLSIKRNLKVKNLSKFSKCQISLIPFYRKILVFSDYFSYEKVPVTADGQISTLEFLEATKGFTTLFGNLESYHKDSLGPAFSPVKSDILGNVTKLMAKYNENPSSSATLQAIVLSEKDAKKKQATEALLWLKRGLEFTSKALRNNVNDVTQELDISFQTAYAVTLSQFHSFLIRPVFSVMTLVLIFLIF